MSDSNFKRLFTAAILSSSVFGATYYWYKHSEVRYSYSGDERALAYVGKVIEDIQRRPASRLLWQSVETGEALYNGEAIRTPSNGEVRIQFANSDRYIDLEADSLIVIKQSEGDIALDLMEGSLFVNAKTGSGEAETMGLVLNSGGSKVDLSNASATLSRGSNNKLDLQVLDGKASVKDKSGKSQELKSGDSGALGQEGLVFNQDSLKIQSPIPSKIIYRLPETSGSVRFQWSGFPQNSKVQLWTGSTRKSLQLSKTTSDLTANELEHNINLGKFYWKLVATNEQGKILGESPVYRNEILPRMTPAVIFPQADAKIPVTTDLFDLSFKWQKTDQTQSMTLEVWSDENLQQLVTEKNFTVEDNFTVPSLKEGSYYWRLNTRFIDDEKPFIGKVEKFTIYKQILQKTKAQVDVAWGMDESENTQFFISEPQLNLKWNASKPEEVAQWRLKIIDEALGLDQQIVKQFDSNQSQLPVAKPGRYIASIEALDKEGDVIGSALPRKIEVSPLPLLPTPQFVNEGTNLQASNDGKMDLQWKETPGAKEYILSIFKNGKELRKSNYSKSSTSLKNLMPGEYEVQLQAVDIHGRPSEGSDTRKIIVPDKSGLKAPSLKKIKVN